MNTELRAYVDRFVNLIEEAEANRADQKELTTEIKDDGFDPATVKKLAALVISDKKARKKKAENEQMALYIREAGLQLDLGFETTVAEIVTQTGGAFTVVSAEPQGPAEGEQPPRPEPIPPSPAGAVLPPSHTATDSDPVAAQSPRAVPAGDTHAGMSTADVSERAGVPEVAECAHTFGRTPGRRMLTCLDCGAPYEDDGLTIPAFLRRNRAEAVE